MNSYTWYLLHFPCLFFFRLRIETLYIICFARTIGSTITLLIHNFCDTKLISLYYTKNSVGEGKEGRGVIKPRPHGPKNRPNNASQEGETDGQAGPLLTPQPRIRTTILGSAGAWFRKAPSNDASTDRRARSLPPPLGGKTPSALGDVPGAHPTGAPYQQGKGDFSQESPQKR